MAKGAKKKARRRAAAMDFEGAPQLAAKPAAMDTDNAVVAPKPKPPASTMSKDKLHVQKRGQKLKIQQKRKKALLQKALAHAEKTETRVQKLTKKVHTKTVLKTLY
uniref:Uncharacterized protein n=1 Tax=Tetraselmis chuii TaxID=63592 RepID=A0A7S1SGG3_9CHLO|mmetsp:Transcript_10503/g.19026  ORF Transcript_10503/g.19026 Transcript_10503/m.19026 type:complete len:106 (+) Transcript_10503:210-527(+)